MAASGWRTLPSTGSTSPGSASCSQAWGSRPKNGCEYRKHRVIAIGISAGKVLTCVYTDRTTADGRVVRRIISLRPASSEGAGTL